MKYKDQKKTFFSKRPKSKIILKMKKMTDRLRLRRRKNLNNKKVQPEADNPPII